MKRNICCFGVLELYPENTENCIVNTDKLVNLTKGHVETQIAFLPACKIIIVDIRASVYT